MVGVVLLDDRNAAAARGNDNIAIVHEILDGIEFHDALRLRGRHHLTPTAAGVLFIGVAGLLGALHGLFLGKEGAYGLRRVLECRILRVDHRLRDDACRGAHDATTLHLVQDGLRQLIADIALAHSSALGKRHSRRLAVMRGSVVECVIDHADLRAVAVGDHDVDSLGHHINDVLGRVLHQLQLLLRRVAQGVAAKSDDHGLAFAFLVCHSSSPFF